MDIALWIFVGVFGAIAGNLATSPLFRWPRNVPLTRDKPFCDSCHAPLEPRDLFPIVSWWLNRGKCRHCGAPIPAIYMVVELIFCVLFLALANHFGMGDDFLLHVVGLGGGVLFAALLWQSEFWSWRAWYMVLVAGIIWRVRHEYVLDGVLDSLLFSGTLCLFFWIWKWQHHTEPLARYQLLCLPAILVWWAPSIWAYGLVLWLGLALLLRGVITLKGHKNQLIATPIAGIATLIFWQLGLTYGSFFS